MRDHEIDDPCKRFISGCFFTLVRARGMMCEYGVTYKEFVDTGNMFGGWREQHKTIEE